MTMQPLKSERSTELTKSRTKSLTVNIWTQRADFGGTARRYAVGLSIGNKGYIGTGLDVSSYRKDFWEYEPTDTTPDPFTFIDQTGVALNTVITSNTITITGVNTATPISIAGGTYAINGGPYTSADGTVDNGDTVTVQQTSMVERHFIRPALRPLLGRRM